MTSRRGSMVAIFLLMGAAMVGWPSGLRSQTEKPDRLPSGTAIPDKAKSLSSEDEAGIRKTINGIEAAWNAHDMDAYARLLRPDVEWVNFVGMHWRGRDAVMLAHRVFHKTTFKNHNIHTDDIHLHPLCPGHAIAVVTTTNDAFTTPAGNVISKRQDRQSYVLGKEPEDGRSSIAKTSGWMLRPPSTILPTSPQTSLLTTHAYKHPRG